MINEKVSVIIPVYNVSKYLRKCLDSVIEQTYKNIEIICVDDGSMDGSSAILDEYAEKDERIQVIHKKNGGISSARNAGLKVSGGGYIVFVDSDDYVESDYIEVLYRGIDGVEAAACGWNSVQNEIKLESCCPEDYIYLTNQKIKDAYQNRKELYKYFRGPISKMYRRDILGNLMFDERLIMGEDIVFNLYFLQRANSVRTISYCGYNIRKRMDSITHQTALRYSVTLEHDYTEYYDARTAAQLNWGFDANMICEKMKERNAAHYYSQAMNLVSLGTPYNRKQIKEKIREINEDKEFIQPILDRKYNDLSVKEKIARFNAQINKPWLTEIIFYSIYKGYSFLIRFAYLRRWNRKK